MKKTFLGGTLKCWILGFMVYGLGLYLGCMVYDEYSKNIGFYIIFMCGIIFSSIAGEIE